MCVWWGSLRGVNVTQVSGACVCGGGAWGEQPYLNVTQVSGTCVCGGGAWGESPLTRGDVCVCVGGGVHG